MNDDVAEFWETFERETGEKVETRGMGAWKGEDDAPEELWGLLVLTDKAFHFRYFPSENWMAGLFGQGRRSGKKRKPVEIAIRREDILEVVVPKRGLLGRLFGQPYETATIRCRDGVGERYRRFSVDRGGPLLSSLLRATDGARAPEGPHGEAGPRGEAPGEGAGSGKD